jgi:VWFA-related protein
MKTYRRGSGVLFWTLLMLTAFVLGGCGVSGGGGSGGGGSGNPPPVSIPPDIEVSAGQLLFGGIVQSNFTDRTLTIQNRGSQNLDIGRIAWADPLDDPPFSIVTDGCSLQTLASMRTCTVVVRFAPTDQGAFSDTFDIPSNDPDENPVTVSVSGDGRGLNVSINQVDTDNCQSVRLYVSVSKSNGDPQTGLLSTHFSIFENNNDRPITDFSGNAASPKSIALILDFSASMIEAIPDMRAAALDFIDQLSFKPADPAQSDEAEIIRYAQSVEQVPQPLFSYDKAYLIDRIQANFDGDDDGTAMYDAVWQAVEDTVALDVGRRRAVVVIADGRDNRSYTDLSELIERALERGVPVFTIGLGDVNAENMQQLADETGGQYYLAPSKDDLQKIYIRISNIISSQYLIEYTSLSSGNNPIVLDVEVDYKTLQGEDSRETIGCP